MRQRRRSSAARTAVRMRLVVPEFPGVTPDLWTELPPAAYPPRVAELIRGVLDARSTGAIVTVNGYRCDTCATVVVTRDLHPGVVPAYADHRRFEGAPGADRCPGMARSLDYPRAVTFAPPSHEWYRPSEPELLALPRTNLRHGERLVDHVLRGGLLLRPIPLEEAPA